MTIDVENTMLLSAVRTLVLLGAITPVMTMTTFPPSYWTASNVTAPYGMTKYHLFLDGVYPSSENRITKLGYDSLVVCLDFSLTIVNPIICHPIKESDIPLTNDGIMDVGYLVVSNKLNESAAGHFFYPSSQWLTGPGPIEPYVLADLYSWLAAHSGLSHPDITTPTSTLEANTTFSGKR